MKASRKIARPWLPPLLVLLLVPAACSDFLNENPRGTLTEVDFFRDGNDAQNALMGAYQSLHARQFLQNRNFPALVTVAGPQVTTRQSPVSIWGCADAFDCGASNGPAANLWRSLYSAINNANTVVDNVAGIQSMDANRRAQIVAEAKFLRSFHYFMLVRLWGGVPLRVNATDRLEGLKGPRATADEVYEFIINDLTEAQKELPLAYPASEFGRATRGAAQTLLAKAYLQRGIAGKSNPFGDALYWPSAQPGDVDNAISELRKVVQSGQYRLVDDYGDLWNEETEQNSEVIFSLQNIMIRDLGTNASTWFAPRRSGLTGSGPWNDFNAELPFYESYEEGDKRREVTWLTEYVDARGNPAKWDRDNIFGDTYANEGPDAAKYIPDRRDIPGVFSDPTDLVLLRYADVLLMLAEALHEKNPGSAEALALVNQVRERAGLAPLAQLTTEALYWERNWELATEAHDRFDAPRFWDLFAEHVHENSLAGQLSPDRYPMRTVPRIEVVLDDTDRLLPIPQEAMDRNPELVQNPGY